MGGVSIGVDLPQVVSHRIGRKRHTLVREPVAPHPGGGASGGSALGKANLLPGSRSAFGEGLELDGEAGIARF